APERPHHAKRTRRGQNRTLCLLQHAGSAKIRLAREFSARKGIPRSARALERTFTGADQVNTRRARRRGTRVRPAAPHYAHTTRYSVEQRGDAVFRSWKDEADGQRCDGSCKGALNAS